jgi:hypothetical protein
MSNGIKRGNAVQLSIYETKKESICLVIFYFYFDHLNIIMQNELDLFCIVFNIYKCILFIYLFWEVIGKIPLYSYPKRMLYKNLSNSPIIELKFFVKQIPRDIYRPIIITKTENS